jgi:predicted nucleotidyltransferase
MAIRTKKSAIKIVTNFAKEVKNQNLHLRKVFLFGSFVNNKQHKWSDIDVALVADEFNNFGFEDMNYFVNVLIKEPYYIIQTQTYSTSYFKKGDPFIDEIKRTGIEIKLD